MAKHPENPEGIRDPIAITKALGSAPSLKLYSTPKWKHEKEYKFDLKESEIDVKNFKQNNLRKIFAEIAGDYYSDSNKADAQTKDFLAAFNETKRGKKNLDKGKEKETNLSNLKRKLKSPYVKKQGGYKEIVAKITKVKGVSKIRIIAKTKEGGSHMLFEANVTSSERGKLFAEAEVKKGNRTALQPLSEEILGTDSRKNKKHRILSAIGRDDLDGLSPAEALGVPETLYEQVNTLSELGIELEIKEDLTKLPAFSEKSFSQLKQTKIELISAIENKSKNNKYDLQTRMDELSYVLKKVTETVLQPVEGARKFSAIKSLTIDTGVVMEVTGTLDPGRIKWESSTKKFEPTYKEKIEKLLEFKRKGGAESKDERSNHEYVTDTYSLRIEVSGKKPNRKKLAREEANNTPNAKFQTIETGNTTDQDRYSARVAINKARQGINITALYKEIKKRGTGGPLWKKTTTELSVKNQIVYQNTDKHIFVTRIILPSKNPGNPDLIWEANKKEGVWTFEEGSLHQSTKTAKLTPTQKFHEQLATFKKNKIKITWENPEKDPTAIIPIRSINNLKVATIYPERLRKFINQEPHTIPLEIIPLEQVFLGLKNYNAELADIKTDIFKATGKNIKSLEFPEIQLLWDGQFKNSLNSDVVYNETGEQTVGLKRWAKSLNSHFDLNRGNTETITPVQKTALFLQKQAATQSQLLAQTKATKIGVSIDSHDAEITMPSHIPQTIDTEIAKIKDLLSGPKTYTPTKITKIQKQLTETFKTLRDLFYPERKDTNWAITRIELIEGIEFDLATTQPMLVMVERYADLNDKNTVEERLQALGWKETAKKANTPLQKQLDDLEASGRIALEWDEGNLPESALEESLIEELKQSNQLLQELSIKLRKNEINGIDDIINTFVTIGEKLSKLPTTLASIEFGNYKIKARVHMARALLWGNDSVFMVSRKKMIVQEGCAEWVKSIVPNFDKELLTVAGEEKQIRKKIQRIPHVEGVEVQSAAITKTSKAKEETRIWSEKTGSLEVPETLLATIRTLSETTAQIGTPGNYNEETLERMTGTLEKALKELHKFNQDEKFGWTLNLIKTSIPGTSTSGEKQTVEHHPGESREDIKILLKGYLSRYGWTKKAETATSTLETPKTKEAQQKALKTGTGYRILLEKVIPEAEWKSKKQKIIDSINALLKDIETSSDGATPYESWRGSILTNTRELGINGVRRANLGKNTVGSYDSGETFLFRLEELSAQKRTAIIAEQGEEALSETTLASHLFYLLQGKTSKDLIEKSKAANTNFTVAIKYYWAKRSITIQHKTDYNNVFAEIINTDSSTVLKVKGESDKTFKKGTKLEVLAKAITEGASRVFDRLAAETEAPAPKDSFEDQNDTLLTEHNIMVMPTKGTTEKPIPQEAYDLLTDISVQIQDISTSITPPGTSPGYSSTQSYDKGFLVRRLLGIREKLKRAKSIIDRAFGDKNPDIMLFDINAVLANNTFKVLAKNKAGNYRLRELDHENNDLIDAWIDGVKNWEKDKSQKNMLEEMGIDPKDRRIEERCGIKRAAEQYFAEQTGVNITIPSTRPFDISTINNLISIIEEIKELTSKTDRNLKDYERLIHLGKFITSPNDKNIPEVTLKNGTTVTHSSFYEIDNADFPNLPFTDNSDLSDWGGFNLSGTNYETMLETEEIKKDLRIGKVKEAAAAKAAATATPAPKAPAAKAAPAAPTAAEKEIAENKEKVQAQLDTLRTDHGITIDWKNSDKIPENQPELSEETITKLIEINATLKALTDKIKSNKTSSLQQKEILKVLNSTLTSILAIESIDLPNIKTISFGQNNLKRYLKSINWYSDEINKLDTLEIKRGAKSFTDNFHKWILSINPSFYLENAPTAPKSAPVRTPPPEPEIKPGLTSSEKLEIKNSRETELEGLLIMGTHENTIDIKVNLLNHDSNINIPGETLNTIKKAGKELEKLLGTKREFSEVILKAITVKILKIHKTLATLQHTSAKKQWEMDTIHLPQIGFDLTNSVPTFVDENDTARKINQKNIETLLVKLGWEKKEKEVKKPAPKPVKSAVLHKPATPGTTLPAGMRTRSIPTAKKPAPRPASTTREVAGASTKHTKAYESDLAEKRTIRIGQQREFLNEQRNTEYGYGDDELGIGMDTRKDVTPNEYSRIVSLRHKSFQFDKGIAALDQTEFTKKWKYFKGPKADIIRTLSKSPFNIHEENIPGKIAEMVKGWDKNINFADFLTAVSGPLEKRFANNTIIREALASTGFQSAGSSLLDTMTRLARKSERTFAAGDYYNEASGLRTTTKEIEALEDFLEDVVIPALEVLNAIQKLRYEESYEHREKTAQIDSPDQEKTREKLAKLASFEKQYKGDKWLMWLTDDDIDQVTMSNIDGTKFALNKGYFRRHSSPKAAINSILENRENYTIENGKKVLNHKAIIENINRMLTLGYINMKLLNKGKATKEQFLNRNSVLDIASFTTEQQIAFQIGFVVKQKSNHYKQIVETAKQVMPNDDADPRIKAALLKLLDKGIPPEQVKAIGNFLVAQIGASVVKRGSKNTNIGLNAGVSYPIPGLKNVSIMIGASGAISTGGALSLDALAGANITIFENDQISATITLGGGLSGAFAGISITANKQGREITVSAGGGMGGVGAGFLMKTENMDKSLQTEQTRKFKEFSTEGESLGQLFKDWETHGENASRKIAILMNSYPKTWDYLNTTLFKPAGLDPENKNDAIQIVYILNAAKSQLIESAQQGTEPTLGISHWGVHVAYAGYPIAIPSVGIHIGSAEVFIPKRREVSRMLKKHSSIRVQQQLQKAMEGIETDMVAGKTLKTISRESTPNLTYSPEGLLMAKESETKVDLSDWETNIDVYNNKLREAEVKLTQVGGKTKLEILNPNGEKDINIHIDPALLSLGLIKDGNSLYLPGDISNLVISRERFTLPFEQTESGASIVDYITIMQKESVEGGRTPEWIRNHSSFSIQKLMGEETLTIEDGPEWEYKKQKNIMEVRGYSSGTTTKSTKKYEQFTPAFLSKTTGLSTERMAKEIEDRREAMGAGTSKENMRSNFYKTLDSIYKNKDFIAELSDTRFIDRPQSIIRLVNKYLSRNRQETLKTDKESSEAVIFMLNEWFTNLAEKKDVKELKAAIISRKKFVLKEVMIPAFQKSAKELGLSNPANLATIFINNMYRELLKNPKQFLKGGVLEILSIPEGAAFFSGSKGYDGKDKKGVMAKTKSYRKSPKEALEGLIHELGLIDVTTKEYKLNQGTNEDMAIAKILLQIASPVPQKEISEQREAKKFLLTPLALKIGNLKAHRLLCMEEPHHENDYNLITQAYKAAYGLDSMTPLQVEAVDRFRQLVQRIRAAEKRGIEYVEIIDGTDLTVQIDIKPEIVGGAYAKCANGSFYADETGYAKVDRETEIGVASVFEETTDTTDAKQSKVFASILTTLAVAVEIKTGDKPKEKIVTKNEEGGAQHKTAPKNPSTGAQGAGSANPGTETKSGNTKNW